MELRNSIIEGTILVFNEKGLKFTMDDIAKQLGISKKTIYTVFSDKEALFFAIVDYMFDSVKACEQQILEDNSLSTLDKIRKLLGAMPEAYKDIDFRQLYILKDKYPQIYHKVEERLETGWEASIQLLEQGISEGVIRPVPIPIIKTMLESALEQFFQRDILLRHNLSYTDALNEVVKIIVDGIACKERI